MGRGLGLPEPVSAIVILFNLDSWIGVDLPGPFGVSDLSEETGVLL